MIKRNIENEIKILFSEFPIVAIIGPRQSGKTTLVKMVFRDFKYVSFEDIDNRDFAREDPRGFLNKYKNRVILDEIQRAPELMSYLQTHVDSANINGQFVITGSHNFLLMERISQSLAGRVGIATLLAFSTTELLRLADFTIEDLLFSGCYPRIYDKKIRPSVFYKNYIATYIERDVRLLKNIEKRDVFIRFLKVLAGRTGQVLNTASISEDCGISHNTVKDWLSVLEASYIVYKLVPFHKNYNKRLIKNPKIYFTDTGLVCSLLGIKSPRELDVHFLKGNIFETFIINEFLKENFNAGDIFNIYFWRDNHRKEIDVILEYGANIYDIEIKSGKTIHPNFFDGLKYWNRLTYGKNLDSYLIYGGSENYLRNEFNIVGWNSINKMLSKIIMK
jgi:predicted AAA+ superfamily ATPase